jgi:hypothetical protein
MFTWRIRDPFGFQSVSCVKLPATVEFPTDDRLLQRLEASRRALPPNSVKALWRARGLECSAAPSALHLHDDVRLKVGAGIPAELERLAPPGAPWTLPPTMYIEDVYARSRVAVGQH